MSNAQEVLRYRILLCFKNEDEEKTSVTNIARILGEPKYTISRMMTAMEQEGLIDKSDERHPKLTDKGHDTAFKFSDKIELAASHLMYEGLDTAHARQDAFFWAMYNSDETMEIIRRTEEKYRVKFALRDRKEFNGRYLSSKFHDGVYQFPFLIYREKIKNGNNISMANNGFDHPCTFVVKDGVGTIQLRAREIEARSKLTGKMMQGRVEKLQYYMNGEYFSAERVAGVYSFPAEVLRFVNMGNGVEQILHGSVVLKMTSSVGPMQMPESTAVFNILI